MKGMIMAKRKQFLNKIISILLIQTFLLSNIAFAAPQENPANVINQDEIIQNPEKIVIPREFGLIKSKYIGKNGKLVVHIQDAHCNYEAQSNIVHILENLIKNYNVSFVSVEGADGIIDTSWFKAFPDEEVRKEVATYFMKKGEITGPEFLSITTDLPIKLFGAETRSHYIENLNAFTSSYPLKEETEKYYTQIKTVLNRLKNYIYTEELKALDSKIQDYESKKLPFNEYVRFLEGLAEKHRINLREYSDFFKLISALIYEKKIDFNVTDKERSALIDELSKSMPKEGLTELVTKSLSFKSGKISSAEYYEYLKSLALKNGIELSKKYPNLSNYIVYNSVYSKIDNEKLFNDIKNLELAIKERLFKNDDQRTLDKLSRHAEILLGLVNIKLLNGDFEYYKTHKEEFTHESFSDFIKKKTVQFGLAYEVDLPSDAVQNSIPRLEDFYSIAIKRDKSLVDNTLNEIKKEKLQAAVLITGGFHSEGITKLLERQGISYLVVSPNITKDVPSPYIQILTNQRTPFEELLVGSGEAKQGMLAPLSLGYAVSLNEKELSKLSQEIRGLGFPVDEVVIKAKEGWLALHLAGWLDRTIKYAADRKISLPRDMEGMRDVYKDALKSGISKVRHPTAGVHLGKTYQERFVDEIILSPTFKKTFDEVYRAKLPDTSVRAKTVGSTLSDDSIDRIIRDYKTQKLVIFEDGRIPDNINTSYKEYADLIDFLKGTISQLSEQDFQDILSSKDVGAESDSAAANAFTKENLLRMLEPGSELRIVLVQPRDQINGIRIPGILMTRIGSNYGHYSTKNNALYIPKGLVDILLKEDSLASRRKIAAAIGHELTEYVVLKSLFPEAKRPALEDMHDIKDIGRKAHFIAQLLEKKIVGPGKDIQKEKMFILGERSALDDTLDNLTVKYFSSITPHVVETVVGRFNLSEADRMYLTQMWIQYLMRKEGIGKKPLKIIADSSKINDVKYDPEQSGNFILASMLNTDERERLLGAFNYLKLEQDQTNADEAKKVVITVNSMDGGIGENLGRLNFLKELAKRQGIDPAKVRMGAKGADLGFFIEKYPGKEIFVSTAEVKLMRLILIAKAKKYAGIHFQPLVNWQSKASYDKLLNSTFLEDRFDDAKKDKWTYGRVMDDVGIKILNMVQQADLPAIKESTGNLSLDIHTPHQPGGHGQFGFQFLYETCFVPAPNDGRTHIRVFYNGDNVNSSVDEHIAGAAAKNNWPIVKLTTSATPIDKKGGKDGVRIEKINGKIVYVPDQMEERDAKNADRGSRGQLETFYNAGLEGGVGESGKQPFNTNIFYINTTVLHSILDELLKQQIISNEEFYEIISPILIEKEAKIDESDGQKYIPIDGAIGTAMHRLNAFFVTSRDPRVKDILTKYGIDRVLYFVEIPRTLFFTPTKFCSDAWLQAFSDYYTGIDTNQWVLYDSRADTTPPEFDLECKIDGKEVYWNELQNLIDSFGNASTVQLKSLKIRGKVLLKDAKLIGNVSIVNKKDALVDLYSYKDKFHEKGLIRDDKLVLDNMSIVINENGDIEITMAAEDGTGAIRLKGGELTKEEHRGRQGVNDAIKELIKVGKAYAILKVGSKPYWWKDIDIPLGEPAKAKLNDSQRKNLAELNDRIKARIFDFIIIRGLKEELKKSGVAADLIFHPGMRRQAVYLDEGDFLYLLSLENGVDLIEEALNHEIAHLNNSEFPEEDIEKFAPSQNVRKALININIAEAQPVGAIRLKGGELTQAEHRGEKGVNDAIGKLVESNNAYAIWKKGYELEGDVRLEEKEPSVLSMIQDENLAKLKEKLKGMRGIGLKFNFVIIQGLKEALRKNGIATDLIFHPGMRRQSIYLDEEDFLYLLSLENGASLIEEAIDHEIAHINNPNMSEEDIEKFAPSYRVRLALTLKEVSEERARIKFENRNFEDGKEYEAGKIYRKPLKKFLKFGTSGVRWLADGSIAMLKAIDPKKYEVLISNAYTQEDFNKPNVAIIAKAIALYNLRKAEGAYDIISGSREDFIRRLREKGLLVMYDNRPGNEDFAKEIAKVLAAYGIKATLAKSDDAYIPTPLSAASLLIKKEGYAGSIYLTASHNGDEWNGIKFNAEDGAPSAPKVTNAIGSILQEEFALERPNYDIAREDIETLIRDGDIGTIDTVDYYVKNVLSYIGKERIEEIKKAVREGKVTLVYSAFYGSSGVVMKRLFRELGLPEENIIETQKPSGTTYVASYEPTLEKLKALREKVNKVMKEGKTVVVLGGSADNDADRFQVNENGVEFTPAILTPILGYYLVTSRGWKNSDFSWGRSFVSSSYQDYAAKLFGQGTQETPTGFKFSPPILGKGGIIFSEESYGLSFKDWTMDKDGILPTLLALELVATTGKSLTQYNEDIKHQLKEKGLPSEFRFERDDMVLTADVKDKAIERFTEFFNSIKENKTTFIGKKITKRYDPAQFEGGMKVTMEDGSWVALRSSGTEPVIRLYMEARNKDEVDILRSEFRRLTGVGSITKVPLPAGFSDDRWEWALGEVGETMWMKTNHTIIAKKNPKTGEWGVPGGGLPVKFNTIEKDIEAAAKLFGLNEGIVRKALADSINKSMLLSDFMESVGLTKKDLALRNMANAGLARIIDEKKGTYELAENIFSSDRLKEFRKIQVESSDNPKMVDLTDLRIERIILNSIGVNKFIGELSKSTNQSHEDLIDNLGANDLFPTLVATWELTARQKEAVPEKVSQLATKAIHKLNLEDLVEPESTKSYRDNGVEVELSLPSGATADPELLQALKDYQNIMLEDMARGGYNYRGTGTSQTIEEFFASYFMKEWYGKIQAFVRANYNENEPLKAIVTNGIGANDQFMWALVRMYNANRPEGAPVWYHVTTARDLAKLKAAGIEGKNALFIDISRSGSTWEGVEVGIRSLLLGFNKRIALANGGAVKAIAQSAAKLGNYEPLIIGMSPDIGGRNMHRKTTIYYTAQTVAGMSLPSMDSKVFARLNDKFDKANDFARPKESIAVSSGRFIHGAMNLLGVEHIAFVTNTEPLRLIGTEWEQYVMEGSNKEDIISMGIHDLAKEPEHVLSNLANSAAGKITIGIILLDKASSNYDRDLERVNAIKDRMPVIIFTIDTTKGELKGNMSPNLQAAFDILWTDLVTVLTTLLRVDANSNPNVKLVRQYTQDRVAGWKEAEENYKKDPLRLGQADLLVSYGYPEKDKNKIGSEGKQETLTMANAKDKAIELAKQLVQSGMLRDRNRLNLFVGRDDLESLVKELRNDTYKTELSTKLGWITQTALFPLFSHKGLEAVLANAKENETGKTLLADKTINIFFNARTLGPNPFFNQEFNNMGIAGVKQEINGATIHQTNDAMTIPNIKRMAEVSPTILFEFNDISEDIEGTIRAFYRGFIGQLIEELREPMTAEQIDKEITDRDIKELENNLFFIVREGIHLNGGKIIIVWDTGISDARTNETILKTQNLVTKYLGDAVINVRGTGEEMLDAANKEAQNEKGNIRAIVTITGDKTLRIKTLSGKTIEEELTALHDKSKVLNIQDKDKDNKPLHIQVPGLTNLAISIGFELNDKIARCLANIGYAFDAVGNPIIDPIAILTQKVIRILPRIRPIDISAEAEAQRLAKESVGKAL